MSWVPGPLVCVVSPLVALPVVVLAPRRRAGVAQLAAAAGLVVQALLIALAAAGSGLLTRGVAAKSDAPALWLASLGVLVDLRLDGLNLGPALLAPAAALVALAASWRQGGEGARWRAAALLVTGAAAVGAFSSLDLVIMGLFVQTAALGVAYLLAAGADGAGRRAAIRFAAYHLVAVGALLGVGLGLQGWLAGEAAASLEQLARAATPAGPQVALLAGAVVAFAIPLGLAPVHGWLAPCCASGGRAGVVLVMGLWHLLGLHGLCRVALTTFPLAVGRWASAGAALAVAATLYAALIAQVQTDLRRRLAWVATALAGPPFLALCTATADGVVGAVVLASAQAPARLALVWLALELRAPSGRGAAAERAGGQRLATPWLLAGLALVAFPGFGTFAGLLVAAVPVARVWPVHGLLLLAGMGLATGALAAPYGQLRQGGAAAGGTATGSGAPRLGACTAAVVLAALSLSLAVGLRPQPLLDLLQPPAQAALDRAGQAHSEAAPARPSTSGARASDPARAAAAAPTGESP